jgi:nitrite reductase/ring-hydroxylating ferredoxin subunit
MTFAQKASGRGTRQAGSGITWNESATGLKNYWYPVCGSRDVGKRYPSKFTRLGHDIAIVRRHGRAFAFLDECPHRGYLMSDGKHEFPGTDTLTCRLHGFTFDLADYGNCVAVLTDGPDSPAVNKVRLRTFPVEERKGIIWVWFGLGTPVPIEEDVSSNILEDNSVVKFRYRTVEGNWRSHAQQEAGHFPMLHRDTIGLLFLQIPAFSIAGEPYMETDEVDGAEYLIQGTVGPPVREAEFPGLGKWPPKRLWRKGRNSRGKLPFKGVHTRGGSFRLPATLRVVNFPFEGGMLYEWYVAEDEDHYTYFQLTCHWPTNPISWLYTQFWYYVWGRPFRKVRFNNQDKGGVGAQWNAWKRNGNNPPMKLYRPDSFNFGIIDMVNEKARGATSPRRVRNVTLPSIAEAGDAVPGK